jgi:fatty acid-binding protein DegV
MVPRDLYYLRARARKKGDRSVGLVSAALGTALDIKPILHCNRGETGPVAKVKGLEAAARRLFDFATERVNAGLLTPTLCLSYGGELTGMRLLPGYEELRAACRDNNIEFHETVMGLTGMVNVGKGALCVGFAAEAHAFQ